MNWIVFEDEWDESYKWFLVDEGKIQYAFKNKLTAQTYKKQGFLDYMLLTNLDNITSDTILDPYEMRSWASKIQTCIKLK